MKYQDYFDEDERLILNYFLQEKKFHCGEQLIQQEEEGNGCFLLNRVLSDWKSTLEKSILTLYWAI